MENVPLSPRAPLSPVGRLTVYGKLAFGHLPTGLGKPAAGFPQPPSFDDDLSLLSMHIYSCRHRTTTDNFSLGLDPSGQWPVANPTHHTRYQKRETRCPHHVIPTEGAERVSGGICGMAAGKPLPSASAQISRLGLRPRSK